MAEQSTLKGRFVVVVFHNQETYYTVAKFRLKQQEKKVITVTGYLTQVQPGVEYELTGSYVTHPRYGLQFAIDSYQQALPDDQEEAVEYLSGSRFPGIGSKTAKRLIADLGKNALEQIRDNPSCLDYLNNAKKQILITGAQAAVSEDERIVQFFSSHHVNMKQILAIRKAYPDQDPVSLVQENPYQLINDVSGIGFETADKLGQSLGFKRNDSRRLIALAQSLLEATLMRTGSSYVPLDEWHAILEKRLDGLDADVDDIITQQVRNATAVLEQDRIYPARQYEAENGIAAYFNRFPSSPLNKPDPSQLEELLSRLEEESGFHYEEKQREAIVRFFDEDVLILTGGPGTGKTTIVRAIIRMIREVYPTSSLALVAPTGRAAKRLKELTGSDARTIHSLLGYDMDSGTFSFNRDNPVLNDILIIDEFSMVDQYVFYHLLDAGAMFRKILLIGDEDQLPPVAPGQVLKDMIDAGFKTVRLEHIYRQKEGSGIIELAHEIAENQFYSFSGHDVRFISADTADIKDVVVQQVLKALQAGYTAEDIQVLAPKYNGLAGIDALNRALQEAMNPADRDKRELKLGLRTLREGDKILQLKNQPDDDVYNGDIGTLEEISLPRETADHHSRILVNYDGTLVEYGADDLDNITHAYCVSVHKAQGSQYPIVILPVCREYGYMLQKRLYYTAVSRAEKALVLVGQVSCFQRAVSTEDPYERKTGLCQKLKENTGYDRKMGKEGKPEA